jgi:hypothetical protein
MLVMFWTFGYEVLGAEMRNDGVNSNATGAYGNDRNAINGTAPGQLGHFGSQVLWML